MKLASAQKSDFPTPATQVQGSTLPILAGLSLPLLLASLGTSIANVALPTLAVTFQATFQQAQWVVLAYLLMNTCLVVSMGRLGDTIGRRRLLLVGLAVFTTASALCAVAPNLKWLIAARAMQGSGAAVMMALTLALVGEFLPKERTGSAMGLLGTMSAVGTALGPSLGGMFIAQFGWTSIFIIMVPMGILALVATQLFLPTVPLERSTKPKTFDYLGTMLMSATLAAYALAMTLGKGQFGLLNLSLLGASVAGAAIFVIYESNIDAPLIQLSAVRNGALRASLIANLIVATVVSATLVVGPFYLSQGLHLDAIGIGLVMSVGPIISIFSGVLAGRLVDRIGTAAMALVGLAVMTAGTLALALLPPIFEVPAYIAAITIIAPGYQLFQAANNTAVMLGVDSEDRGAISGLLSLSRNLGLITGASLMGAVYTFASSRGNGNVPDSAAGLRETFLLATMLMLVALLVAALARRKV
jgi:EmrB/QacA subfamily drug resistance transporter